MAKDLAPLIRSREEKLHANIHEAVAEYAKLRGKFQLTRSKIFSLWKPFSYITILETYIRFGQNLYFNGARHWVITIARIDIVPEYQRQGCFTRLLRHVEQLALEFDFAYVQVELIHNEHLAAFLLRDGYINERFAITGDPVDANAPTLIKRIGE